MAKRTRPFIRYPGSKNTLARWIMGYYPDLHDTYVEVCGGSGSVLFAKERSGIEVYNDIDGDLVHLFRTLRGHPKELERAIRFTAWSPLELSMAAANEAVSDPIERARRFYARLWMSRYPFDKKPSFRRQKIYSRGASGRSSMKAAAVSFTETEHLYTLADRLRGVTIESKDASDLVALYDYDRALFYVDPPYVHAERSRSAHYAVEMSEADHARLADTLNNIDGMAIVSGYAGPLYARLYEARGWKRVDKTARVDGSAQRIESLWLNKAVLRELEIGQQPGLI